LSEILFTYIVESERVMTYSSSYNLKMYYLRK